MPNNNVPICILAYNEERHIQQCVRAVIEGVDTRYYKVFVYANGCTDRTEDIVNVLATDYGFVYLRSLEVASKPLAWNAAFAEHQTEFIIFSDGDVIPEPNAAKMLLAALRSHPDAVIATSRQLPCTQKLDYQQKIVGFMQFPLLHEFLYGGFYAVRRQVLTNIMKQKGFNELPANIAGDDSFLEFILKSNQLIVVECNTYYEPPNFKDYFRYLARTRWENDQLHTVYGLYLINNRGIMRKTCHKIITCKDKRYLLFSIPAVVCRSIFKKLFYRRIDDIYRSLGPINSDGSVILSTLTRSYSTK